MEERIKELELERDNLLRTTDDIRLTRNSTTHSRIKALYNRRITMLRKYGVEYGFQSKEIRVKIHETNLMKYGSLSILGNDEFRKQYDINNNFRKFEIKKKSRITCSSRYGVWYPTKSFRIRAKVRQTNLQRYGTPNGKKRN